eukprot:CAMPEP_0113471280 /NCGR_PEP_ID=MMETSP0014_2-20120614/16895_1 /TAXON_ID=2857 /ORGANISM="Nitzschia sp." /LENGTH=1267 /DNA_ID=CAMNT_0000363907 /DNA_START=9 /DNA_END=3812 /DNA_ORIENTATION=+ /assembly_acc=CAM_ASM_000159
MPADPRRQRRVSQQQQQEEEEEDGDGVGNVGSLLLAGDDAMDEDEEDEDLFGGDDGDGDDDHHSDRHGNDRDLEQAAMATTSDGGIASSGGTAAPGNTPSSVIPSAGYPTATEPASSSLPSSSTHFQPAGLISTIITPSPFAHHTSGPTASRYRNFLQRITMNPRADTEAWSAVVGEASTCWKTLVQQGTMMIFLADAETQLRLDWIESCYGALLKYFPYSTVNCASIGEILYILSAQVGEDGGPRQDYGGMLSTNQGSQGRTQSAQRKLETILAETLGYDLDGNSITLPPSPEGGGREADYNQNNPSDTAMATSSSTTVQGQQQQHLSKRIISPQLGGMCTSSVELWLLYIKTRSRHIRRKYGLPPSFNFSSTSMASMPVSMLSPQQLDAAKAMLEDTKKSFQLATHHAGSTCFDNNILWREYLAFAKAQTPVIAANEQDRNANLLLVTPQQHMAWLRSIYQSLITNPMKGLDQFWKEYEDFEKSQNEQLAAALIQEWQPKYHHTRNVYLERLNRVFNPDDLKWKEKWATPPVSSIRYEDEDDGGEEYYYDEATNTTVPVNFDAFNTGDVAMTSADGTTGVIKKKKRKRWQKVDGGSGVGDTGGSGVDDGNVGFDSIDEYQKKMKEEFDYLALWKKRVAFERTDPERIDNPLELAHRVRSAYKEMLCVLTLYPEVWHMWSMWEDLQAPPSHSALLLGKDDAIADTPPPSKTTNAAAVLRLGQTFLPDSTLLVHGESQLIEIHAALADGKAPLGAKPSDCLNVWERFLDRAPNSLAFCIYQRLVRRYQGIEPARKVFSRARRVLLSSPSTLTRSVDGAIVDKETGTTQDVNGETEESTKINGILEDGRTRCMVTNRLDPSVGQRPNQSGSTNKNHRQSEKLVAPDTVYVGPCTWHLYASHATIEHRVNKLPETAARIYELGLRKHSSFLTKPAYILKYGRLLMELQDTVNLRALLTRALAACGTSKTPQVESLWDMTLQCEELWSIGDPSNLDNVISVERKRRAALLGKDTEDVATGTFLDAEENKIGSQKTSLSELLIGNDGGGYNTSSMIVNGVNRSVDVLDVMGLWSDGAGAPNFYSSILALRNSDDGDDMISGGRSDRSYDRRSQFARKMAVGLGSNTSAGTSALSDAGGTKTTTARERFQQGGGQQNAPIQLAIQQSPDWLRPFLLLLPASRLRGVVAKAPPHMVEMALSSLRNSQLPAERPNDGPGSATGTSLSGSKRSLSQSAGGGGDDSDEDESVPSGSGGYGTTFRSRQRSKLTTMND